MVCAHAYMWLFFGYDLTHLISGIVKWAIIVIKRNKDAKIVGGVNLYNYCLSNSEDAI